MTSDEIRKSFLNFFAKKGHTIVASDSVVPKDDPTVLFTTAGMQQFKRQFLGQIDNYTRATTSQKCLRTDDLDKVGKTPFHHTFFEMLGNFSFGDYFKKEAIAWAWEFLTEELRISQDKLWVSVYEEDTEAENIWLQDIKIPANRLVRLGDKSNFWPSEAKTRGPNGPCGPCSEIFFDYGVSPNCKNPHCNPDCDCGRFAEVWNLVFTQFNRKEDGALEPLPAKNIDTGMGFERLVAVIQGKRNNFDTDLFAPMIRNIKELINGISETDARIIADHIRAIVFAIGDGVVPSNKERGFVVKKLITTVSDIMLRHIDQTFVHKLVWHVIDVMKDAYPNLENKAKEIEGYIRRTEEDYESVYIKQIPELKKRIWDIGQTNQPKEQKIKELGKLFFFFRDTHGLSNSTIYETAQSAGIGPESLDVINQLKDSIAVSNQLMEEQKDRSRAGSKMTGDVFTDAELKLNVPKTEFVGYDNFEATGKILKIFIGKDDTAMAQKQDEVKIILDKTPFYAEGGGQVGDTGVLVTENARVTIKDTKKIADVFIHSGIVEEGQIRPGEIVELKIDKERRLSIMRHHTATHLLQAALRKILGNHVQQQGSLVEETRLRFDFTHPQPIKKNEISAIENLINGYVLSCDNIDKNVMSFQEAKSHGALAFFAEKYGERVRVVTVDGYSRELCGGTHLNNTGQTGLFKIIAESAIAQGIRRIEAVTGTHALQFVASREQRLNELANILKTSNEEVVERVKIQTQKMKQLEKELSTIRFDAIKNSLDDIIKTTRVLNGVRVVSHIFKNVGMETLRKTSDLIRDKIRSGVITLCSEQPDGAFILIFVTEDLIKRGLNADEIIREIAPIIKGSGGGRPQLAQAGSKDTGHLKDALKHVEKLVQEKANP